MTSQDQSSTQQERATARRLYEDHHNVILPDDYDVHHIVPTRRDGSNEIENLDALSIEDHAQAHLELYRKHGDSRDLCAYHMILGRSQNPLENRLANAAAGGRASQIAKKVRGESNGFQAFSEEKRRMIASHAGSIGGLKQSALGLGIHGMTFERAAEVSAMGGRASCLVNDWADPAVQSENGKRGGVKNKGSRWYTDGVTTFKYTSLHQTMECFDDFLTRNPNLRKGRAQ